MLSNPKAMVQYGSLFAALLPTPLPPLLDAVLPLAIFALEAGWYGVVALLLSAPGPRRGYLAAKRWIDRLAGVVMALLGLKLLLSVPGAWR